MGISLKRRLREVFGDYRIRRAKALRTRLACRVEVGPWRRPGLNGLDIRLAAAIGCPQGGTFIEVGGNDGIQQSNSFLLERELGWTGILIEGIPELAAEALRNRPQATVVCAAVTGAAELEIVRMNDNDLMSGVADCASRLCVATTTLSTVIDSILQGEAPDLLSIDVEGLELEVIAGLDLDRHIPKWILVETGRIAEVGNALHGYDLIAALSHHDYLFERSARE